MVATKCQSQLTLDYKISSLRQIPFFHIHNNHFIGKMKSWQFFDNCQLKTFEYHFKERENNYKDLWPYWKVPWKSKTVHFQTLCTWPLSIYRSRAWTYHSFSQCHQGPMRNFDVQSSWVCSGCNILSKPMTRNSTFTGFNELVNFQLIWKLDIMYIYYKLTRSRVTTVYNFCYFFVDQILEQNVSTMIFLNI